MSDYNITVIDSVMGSGKTTAAINYINNLPDDQRFIFVTPYLKEVTRIMESSTKKIYEPYHEEHRKLLGFRTLLTEQKNIVTTHSLFNMMEDEDISLLEEGNYICFIDEVLNCISPYEPWKDKEKSEKKFNEFDVKYIAETLCTRGSDNILRWNTPSYFNGAFDDERKLIESSRLAYSFDGSLLQVFPFSFLKAFKKVFVLTYLFEGSMMASCFKYFGIQYTYSYITGDSLENLTFTEDENLKREYLVDYRELIHILESPKLNEIGQDRYSLTVNWFANRATKEEIEQLGKNMRNAFLSMPNSKSSKCLWTTFAAYEEDVSRGRYAKCFAPVNAKASNEWADRNAVAYLANRFMNTKVASFFNGAGVPINNDMFALSEMIQFIWRSSIRRGEPISIYIPSSRMRSLLKGWIEKNSPKTSQITDKN